MNCDFKKTVLFRIILHICDINCIGINTVFMILIAYKFKITFFTL